MKRIVLALILIAAALPAAGQRFVPNASVGEVSFGLGPCGPMKGTNGMDAAYWLNYSKYTGNHIGYRIGVRYMPENWNVANLVTFPLAVSFRTGMREGNEALAYGTVIALDLFDAFLWESDNIFVDMMAAFLLAFVNRGEFFIGLTPGYIMGDESIRRIYYTSGSGNYIEEQVTSCPNHFYLAAEAGLGITWRIWRFTLNCAPYFQWNFLNNYQKSSRILGDPSSPVTYYNTSNWYFGMNFGLGYLF